MNPADLRPHDKITHSRERAWGQFGIRRASPRIAGLAVADSPDVFTQAEVLERLGLADDEFAAGIFARCGVQRRHLNLSSDFLARTLQGRAAVVEEDLMRQAVEAIDALDVDPDTIGTVLSASFYSLGGPTLAHRLVEHYRMDPTTDKYHVVGVGCASVVPLLRLAAGSLHQHPHKHALVVAAESMSSLLMPARPDDTKAKTVGSAIFGDGCAAALLSSDATAARRANSAGPTILASQVHQIPGTLHAVSLALAPHDSYLQLARELPDLAAAGVGALVEEFLLHHRLERSGIDHWVLHPGGRRIIEGVQEALALSDEDAAISWQSLADHGNVGTPSIFYVLNSTIEQRRPQPGELGLVVTIGPGVTIGLMLLQW